MSCAANDNKPADDFLLLLLLLLALLLLLLLPDLAAWLTQSQIKN